MSLIACWLFFPAILALVAQGCGTLVRLAAGRPLALGVRLPCGLALAMAVMELCTHTVTTASWAVPLVSALSLLGLVLSVPYRRVRALWRDRAGWRDPRAARGVRLNPGALCGVAVFAAYAAPIVLTGEATWAGYIKLDDTATWLSLVDRALSHGRSLAGLPPSTYRAVLAAYLATGYPLGSFLPLGLGHALTGQDIAWLTDPWMAFMASMLSLALYQALAPVVRRTWPRVLIAIVAPLSTLLYGYYLWGGMKEMAAAFLVGAFAVSAPLALSGERRLRATIPALVVVWAIIASLSAGGLVWLGPGALLAVVALAPGRLRRPPLPVAAVGVVVTGVGAYLVFRPGGFVEHYHAVLTGGDELGNLVHALSVQQLAGIWFNGDFRYSPAPAGLTHVLVVVVAIAGAFGLGMALWRGWRELALYVLCALAGALLVFAIASPWLGGKALATGSPALPLAALVGAVALFGLGRAQADRGIGLALRAAGVAVAVATAGGVVASDLLAYHGVSLAPRALFAQLETVGDRIAGQGPTLMTEYQPYGARHFLRNAAAESASELRTRLDPLISGQPLAKGGDADIDQFQLTAVLAYRTLVLQRSPTGSRPPSPYRLIFSDGYWQVWQRPLTVNPPVLEHMPLGTAIAPGAVPSCTAVLELARHPGVSELVAPPVQNPLVVAAAASNHPARWSTGISYLALKGSGTASIPVTVAAPGRYSLWLGGSIRGPVTISVDGHTVSTVRNQIQEAGQYVPFGQVGLSAGHHRVQLHHGDSVLLAGDGGPADIVGPLVLSRVAPRAPLLRVPASRASSLCGRTLDWVEALG